MDRTRGAVVGALAAASLVSAAMLVMPGARADMNFGNYQVLSSRWTDASWIWAVYPCNTVGEFNDNYATDCVDIQALPSPKFGAYYGGTARLDGNVYSFTTDVPDGLRCLGQALPSRDTYTWDASTLAGTIESHYDVGCFNGPPGVNFWDFALKRW